MHADDEFTPPRPDPALRRLDFLVGTWSLTGQFDSSGETGGELRGTATFRRLPGGFFLAHHWSRTFHLDGHRVQDTGYEFYDSVLETEGNRGVVVVPLVLAAAHPHVGASRAGSGPCRTGCPRPAKRLESGRAETTRFSLRHSLA